MSNNSDVSKLSNTEWTDLDTVEWAEIETIEFIDHNSKNYKSLKNIELKEDNM